MDTLTRETLDSLIEDAVDFARFPTEQSVRAEFEAWLHLHLGVGKIGYISTWAGSFEEAPNYERASALVEGLPLKENQWLELERELTGDGVVVRAVIWTSDDGLSYEDNESATGANVYSLADLKGKLL